MLTQGPATAGPYQAPYSGDPASSPHLPVPTLGPYPPTPAPSYQPGPPSHPGRAQRGWGIGLMYFGFAQLAITLISITSLTSTGVSIAGYLTGLVASILFYGGVSAGGIALYRAGRRKRDEHRQIEPPPPDSGPTGR